MHLLAYALAGSALACLLACLLRHLLVACFLDLDLDQFIC
jgi:hypothetical protein